MGNGVSGLFDVDHESGSDQTSLRNLPDDCVARILMGFGAMEICQLARVNRTFRRAGNADFIWEKLLPENYSMFIERVIGSEFDNGFKMKKEIFSRFCRHNFFDGGTKEFWVDKQSGGICMSISSKALLITGIDDRRYWKCVATEESRFRKVAYLQQIWWLEVKGELEFHFPKGSYSLYFRLHLGLPTKRLGRRICNTQHIHGWDLKPVRFQLSTSDGQKSQSKCYLEEQGYWILYHVGDFTVNKCDEITKLKFSMVQIDCTHIKGGLCVDSVFICPKGLELKEAA